MTNRQITRIEKILASQPELSYRDARDLAMEYGADGITAGQLCEHRR